MTTLEGTAIIPVGSTAPTPFHHHNNSSIQQRSFLNFEDLSRRLVLLPRVEDEGIGAVVASYEEPLDSNAAVATTNRQNITAGPDDRVDSGQTENAATHHHHHHHNNCLVGCVLVGTSTSREDWRDTDFATILSVLRGQPGPIVLEFTNMELEGAGGEEAPPQEEAVDYALRLGKSASSSSSHNNNNNSSMEDVADMESISSDSDSSEVSQQEIMSAQPQEEEPSTNTPELTVATEPAATTADSNNNNNNNNTMARWSAWGTRMRQQAQQAAEQASQQAAQALQAAQASRAAALKAAEEARAARAVQEQEEAGCCGIHVQTSLGAFLPLTTATHSAKKRNSSTPQNNNNNNSLTSPRQPPSELTVTTSSVLYIRTSAVEPCPSRGFTYQWYKGRPEVSKQAALGVNDHDTTTSSNSNRSEAWRILPGATSAAFQPSTTEVGYQLLCLVTMDAKAHYNNTHTGGASSLLDSDDSDSDDSDSDNNDDKKVTTLRCVTPQVVAADLSLFNGARQALVRGAQFGGLQGRGRAQGRHFRILVEMGTPPETSETEGSPSHKQTANQYKKHAVASRVQIHQVSGETAEPLHDTPFYRVSAHSVHTNSKHVDLQLFPGSPEDAPSDDVTSSADSANAASLMSALVTDEGILELVASNRFLRESLLLTIGIANFKGKPSELEATTILYSTEDEDNETEEDVVSSSGSSSEEGSVASLSAASVHSADGDSPVRSDEKYVSQAKSPPQVVERLTLSPANSVKSLQEEQASIPAEDGSVSSAGGASSTASATSAVAATAPEAPPQHTPQKVRELLGPTDRELELEKDLAFLRSKLTRKDKVISELQRQVTQSDHALQQSNQRVSKLKEKVEEVQSDLQSSRRVQKSAEQMVDEHVATMTKLRGEQSIQIAKLNMQVESQASTIADLEKTVKSHSNEKAVLTAAVEARESKLGKMAELQESFVSLSAKVSQQDQWRKELDEITQRYQELKGDLQKATQLEKDCRNELQSTKENMETLRKETQGAKDTATTCREELKVVQTKNQKLKSERNSYKQKADSLAKEISRICKNGRSLADIEKILADTVVREEEVQLLRKQKRKVSEECQSYRRSYEQSRAAQQVMLHANASPKKTKDNQNSALLLERNVELERLVTEMTEYVNAKEMQLETTKQVNAALQEEIHGLAKANMNKNEI